MLRVIVILFRGKKKGALILYELVEPLVSDNVIAFSSVSW